MVIRPYASADLEQVLALFYNTVHYINCRDYSPAQLDAWAPAAPDKERWASPLSAHAAWVAELNGTLTGFADLDFPSHYLDRLYVHKDFQRQGVASALCSELERTARNHGLLQLHTEASITARPFFERRGYRVTRVQHKPLRGQMFLNYIMEKEL